MEISYLHLALAKPILAYFLTNSPAAMLEIFDEVALDTILVFFPAYKRIHSEVHVRVSDLPLSSSFCDLRRSNLNNLDGPRLGCGNAKNRRLPSTQICQV